jgi:putative transposase
MIVMPSLIRSIASRLVAWIAQRINPVVKAICRPARGQTLTSTVLDLSRSKPDLSAENALLRHQLVMLKRSIKRPTLKPKDRLSLLLLAKVTRTWRQVLFIVQPATLLRWHRDGFRLFWRLKSKPVQRQPRISTETIGLIRQMANENPLWGAERIRGELLKLGIHVSKQTVQRYRGQQPPPGRSSQTWSTFLKTHAKDIWACDFVPVIDLVFRNLYAFFIIEIHSRRVVHFNVTRHPTQLWVAQQLREATPDHQKPKYIIRDNDGKFGSAFDAVAKQSGIEVIRTPIQAPKTNG